LGNPRPLRTVAHARRGLVGRAHGAEREEKARKWAKMVDNGEKWSKVVPRA
jgi:hypothetical protein